MPHHQQPSPSCPGPKFVRRTDLSPAIRLYIGVTAVLAQQRKPWGRMTQLAREYVISRTFVYLLAFQAEQVSEAFFGQHAETSRQSIEQARLPYAYRDS